jgi:phosphate acetyltransferase
VCLGLVHALDRVGMRVGFMKPVAQPGQQAGPERSTHFIRSTTDLQPPEPLPFPQVEQLLRQGRQGQLLEEVLTRVQQAAEGVDVLVVEGLATELDTLSFEQLNASIADALDAEVILVGAVGRGTVESFCQRLELSAALYGAGERVLGCIVNRFNAPLQVSGANRSLLQPPDPLLEASDLLNGCALLQRPDFKLIGVIPWERELASLRTTDVAQQLGAQVLHRGEADSRRVVDVSLVARTVANMTGRLRPGALIVTPGDRDDIILAACMAALNGVPLAGLLLTGGIEPDANIMKLCSNAIETGLPVLWIGTDSYMTSAAAAALNQEVPLDDLQRIERVMETIAGHLDVAFLQQRAAAGEEREPRMSPAAFLYSLVNRARQADRRIVLPEGTEPRTVRAAVNCVERGITRCVLLGEPAEVQRVAEAQGLTLPAGLEIIDPGPIRSRYVQPLVELRAHRGMTEPVAREQVKDDVVLGMLMLARGEVDGLVSGAVHTTANILRPALQLIGTREDARLVSSVFFMCLPEQVLVYGDCAVNPDPDAEQLADIAIQSAESAGLFGIAPRVAMISYSTGASGAGVDVEKVREATHIAQERRPDLLIDGPLQYDAASVQSVALSKAPESKVAGRATVIIFPDLNTGNTTYKAVQRSANVVSVGPMLQGLRRPVNDLSRGALVDDIIYTIALTAVQAAA